MDSRSPPLKPEKNRVNHSTQLARKRKFKENYLIGPIGSLDIRTN